MKRIATLATVIVISTVGLGVLGAATADAATAGPVIVNQSISADQAISQLKSQGYNVVVHKTGNRPMNQSTITSVRPGHTYSRTDSGVARRQFIGGPSVNTLVTARTIYVTVE